jgi:phosphoribosyl 1,2-cyclic phosphodiesterase
MYLRFWGTRGSIPTPGPDTIKYGGNTSCVEVGAGGKLIVLDAGSGIRPLGQDILARPDAPRDLHILITHTHWDHIQGFPYFAPAFRQEFDLQIYGCQGTGNHIEKVLENQMADDYFPLNFQELSAKKTFTDIGSDPFSIGPVTIGAVFVNHPGLSLGYSLECEGKKIVYCPDMEPFRQNVLSDDSEVNLNIRDYVDNLDMKIVDFARGADCLLIDGMYTDAEYAEKPGWGHSSVSDSIRFAAQAEARRVFLIHHDPGHSDDFIDRMVEGARALAREMGSNLVCEGGQEGLTIEL